MKYMLFWLVTILLFTLSIKENVHIANYMLLSFLFFLLTKEYFAILFYEKLWCKRSTNKLNYFLYTDQFVLKTGINKVTLPRFNFFYTVKDKEYSGNFTYDVRFFNTEENTVHFSKKINNINFFYNPKKPSDYFVIKPKNKSMIIEQRILLVLFLLSSVSLMFNIF